MKDSTKSYIFSICLFLTSVFLFADHKYLCKYDMNPLCFIGCAWPTIFSVLFFMLGKAYKDEEDNDRK